jgi:hypothetical protein
VPPRAKVVAQTPRRVIPGVTQHQRGSNW